VSSKIETRSVEILTLVGIAKQLQAITNQWRSHGLAAGCRRELKRIAERVLGVATNGDSPSRPTYSGTKFSSHFSLNVSRIGNQEVNTMQALIHLIGEQHLTPEVVDRLALWMTTESAHQSFEQFWQSDDPPVTDDDLEAVFG
tara:strand:+ start:284 stop:712 length:429 start_codon:yes stop_codon:yes gene_type:complete